MLGLLFLLLPVAAMYGWVMGRNSVRQAQHNRSKILSKHYFKGLNFLLSDEPDKAVDTLIKMISLDNDTVETHVAMGNFFRHRGELDRAIRIHQNLVTRDEIQKNHKELALKELGRDYILAGFLERAENAYLQLLDSENYFVDAQFQLFNLYQTTKEWDKAIELSEKMTKGREADDELCKHIAHFYCERALDYAKHQEQSKAEMLLNKAIKVDDNNVRPWIIFGDLALEQERYQDSFDCYCEVVKRDVSWLSEVVLKMETCANALQKTSLLEKILADHWQSCASAYLVKTRLLYAQSEQEANVFLQESLAKSPTMKGFCFLLEKLNEQPLDGNIKEVLATLQSLISQQSKLRPDYRCQNCGFSGKKVYWSCPSCKKWGTVKPIKGLDGE